MGSEDARSQVRVDFTGSATHVHKNPKKVRFTSVETREYPMTLGWNPATTIGAPVTLDWDYVERPPRSLNDKKGGKHWKPQKPKSPREFYLNYYQRQAILDKAGFSKDDMSKAERSVKWARMKRKWSERQSFPILYIKAWRVQFARYKTKRFVRRYRKEHGLPQR